MLTATQTAVHPEHDTGQEKDARRICPLNAMELRQVWSLIEETQSSILLGFSDYDLVQDLVGKMEARDLIHTSESQSLRAYLKSRLLLIRDFARGRTQVSSRNSK